ncbi:MAG TPA: ABC transporter ATP-binding protein [Sphingobacteriaceae bacterium]|nr:ABC transporter ATP-binding protein [Sphingobacteriaceae bacterium]
MKTYFRLLSFAKPIEKFAIPYIIATLLSIIFNTLNFTLLVPLLKTLFSEKNTVVEILKKPEGINILDYYTYYVQQGINSYGGWVVLQFVCGVIILSVLLTNLFKYFSQRIMENLRVHTLLNLRRTVFNNVMDLHLGFFSNERKGDIISKIASDVQVVQYSVTSTLQVVFKEPVQLIAYIAMLFVISAELTLYTLLILPVSAFIIARIVKRLRHQAVSAQQSFGLMISFLDEALSGIKIIKAFNATGQVKQKFEDENRNYTRLLRKMAKRQQLASPVSETLGVTMVSFIVLYGGYLIFNNNSDLEAESFIGYIIIFSQVMRPAKALTDSFSNIHSGIAAGERILELIDSKPLISDIENPVHINDFKDKIAFHNVSFCYDTDRVILDDITFDLPKGKTIALVGPSGGGKSTLIDLIPRFIESQKGSILFDGTDITTISMVSLRSQMGVVNQESILFNDTIFNNIAFGKPGATQPEVEEAAKVANAHEFILKTEFGYQTNIGDRGMKLSGGQKQRLNIARAVLSNPAILLLDEATSALDTESEKLVQDALNNLLKNRTSLVIAHRLSTIQNADKILVLDGGKIVEEGTHQELIRNNGLYNKLTEMQAFLE